MKKRIMRFNLCPYLIMVTLIMNIGILGHNAIFAHRIAESNTQGLLTADAVVWLVDKLKQNIDSPIQTAESLTLESILKIKSHSEWEHPPELIRLPNTKSVEEWISNEPLGLWSKMIHSSSVEFERFISELDSDDWSMVRTLQYLMSTLLGNPNSTHVIIFAQSVWNLVDHGLVPQDIAALQVHRMLRKYLYDW